jgi:hypothetical protein
MKRSNRITLKVLLEDLNLGGGSPGQAEVKLHPEQKAAIMEMVSHYNDFGKHLKRERSLPEIASKISEITKNAETFMVNETGDWFDSVTVKKNAKDLNKCSEDFAKIASEAHLYEQRMTAAYEDMGHILQRYFDIKEIAEAVSPQAPTSPTVNENDEEIDA